MSRAGIFANTLPMWAFEEPNVFEKINMLRRDANLVFENRSKAIVPALPGRDIQILEFKLHPSKKGFSTQEGLARMLHDLASIELQAMELGLRTLVEFPEAPDEFKEKLWQVTLSESEHLELCLREIESLGYKWGDWPINCGLWQSVHSQDSLLDRILIVHRYLEGSGLDAGDTLLRRLAGVDAKSVYQVVKIINTDEIDHVQFGSDWYRRICELQSIDPENDFAKRFMRLRSILPKRISPINHDLRRKSGFTITEIEFLEKLRSSFFEKLN